MITANQILAFLEDYAYAFLTPDKHKEYCEIFLNPSPSELRKISSDSIKFLALKNTKDVYVWDAYISPHDQVRRFLSKQPGIHPDILNSIRGVASWDRNNQLVISFPEPREIENKCPWVLKYFVLPPPRYLA